MLQDAADGRPGDAYQQPTTADADAGAGAGGQHDDVEDFNIAQVHA